MNRDEKAAVIEEIAGQLEAAEAVFAVDYRGISVSQVADLRTQLREADATFRIVKNSLTERAADQAGTEALKALLDGPTALTFVRGDAAMAAKALSDAARTTQVLDFKGGVMNGVALSPDEMRSIARLPSRDVLYAQLVGVVASPISGLVRTLNALIAGLAIQLKAIHDQGLVSGAAPEPAAAEPESAVEAAEPETTPEPEAAAEPAADAEPSEAEPAAETEPDPDDQTDAAADAAEAADAKED
jgi:large subunit ribosomal protein L10